MGYVQKYELFFVQAQVRHEGLEDVHEFGPRHRVTPLSPVPLGVPTRPLRVCTPVGVGCPDGRTVGRRHYSCSTRDACSDRFRGLRECRTR